MKRKGFTLIELLAVIVILAIIALIAVPIILNIIGDTKKQSDERSIDLYGKAVMNAITKSQLDGTEILPGDLSEEFLKTVEYEGNKVECTTNKLYEDGTIYLSDCKVDGNKAEYTYGKEQQEPYKQVYKPQYYSYLANGYIGKSLPADKKTIPEFEYYGYVIGLDSEDGSTVSAAYVCFQRNGNEYCLKGNDPEAYETNVNILNEAFKDVENACSLESDSYKCKVSPNPSVNKSNGYVSLSSGNYCFVESDGHFYSADGPLVSPVF